jgi:hypothetical protein
MIFNFCQTIKNNDILGIVDLTTNQYLPDFRSSIEDIFSE